MNYMCHKCHGLFDQVAARRMSRDRLVCPYCHAEDLEKVQEGVNYYKLQLRFLTHIVNNELYSDQGMALFMRVVPDFVGPDEFTWYRTVHNYGSMIEWIQVSSSKAIELEEARRTAC